MDRKKAYQALRILPSHVDKAVKLAEKVLSGACCDVDSDHLGFMALCFLSEQVGYLRAIRELVPRGLGKPAGLIGRTMLEGLALLRWAQADPKRSLRWRQYAVVADYRTMLRYMVDREQKARIEAAAQQFGDQFLTQKAKNARADGGSLPQDPYVRSWYAPHSAAVIFGQIKGAKPLYDHIYRAESEKTHWSVAALGQNVHRTPRGLSYAGDSSPEDSATALAVGFQSLMETLMDVDNHFQLGRDTDIRSLVDGVDRDITASPYP